MLRPKLLLLAKTSGAEVWLAAGSCFAGLRIIGDNNFPSLSSYFGLSARSKNYPILLLLLGGKSPKVETSCKRIL